MKVKYPKGRSAGFSLAFFLSLALSGCCTCLERYQPFLEQVESNLREDIRPKYEEALRASGRDERLITNDLGLIDDSADAIKRVRTLGVSSWSLEGGR